jgi:2'-5' RNA ligase
MRLFIAINLNDEWKDWLMNAAGVLKSSAVKGRFTPRENLHLTLAFLGEIDASKLALVKHCMDQILERTFLLYLDGLGRFKGKDGDLYWAGVKKNNALLDLQNKLSDALVNAGFSLDNRKFSPHLTLGRQVRLRDESQRMDLINSLAKEGPGMKVNRISLMKSERISGRMVYTEQYGRDLAE